MHTTPTVLILTAHYGEGHVQTAQTLADTFLQKDVQNVHVCDLYGEAYPAIHTFAQTLLKKSFSRLGAPLYKMFYYGTDKLSSRGLSYFYQHLGKKRLLELVEIYRPDIIITTFPMHAGAYLRSRPAFNIPTYTVITDYCVHPLWTHPMIEKYYVASQEVKETLTRYGIKVKRIHVSGLPIRRVFTSNTNKISAKHYNKLGLDPDKKTVTIAGGGLGLLPNVEEICSVISSPSVQVAILCGRNSELKERLHQEFHNKKNIRVFGYLNNIQELLSVTDCLVTKSGAVTLTEAAALNIPMVIIRPNPGQETENARYFESKGAAFIAENHDAVFSCISSILSDDSIRLRFMKGFHSINKQEAAMNIVDDILFQNKKYLHKEGAF